MILKKQLFTSNTYNLKEKSAITKNMVFNLKS